MVLWRKPVTEKLTCRWWCPRTQRYIPDACGAHSHHGSSSRRRSSTSCKHITRMRRHVTWWHSHTLTIKIIQKGGNFYSSTSLLAALTRFQRHVWEPGRGDTVAELLSGRRGAARNSLRIFGEDRGGGNRRVR